MGAAPRRAGEAGGVLPPRFFVSAYTPLGVTPGKGGVVVVFNGAPQVAAGKEALNFSPAGCATATAAEQAACLLAYPIFKNKTLVSRATKQFLI